MSTLLVSGIVTNAGGASSNFTGTITIDDNPVINSIVISPTHGPKGTLFTITVNATDPNTPPEPLNYSLTVNGTTTGVVQTATPNVFTYQS